MPTCWSARQGRTGSIARCQGGRWSAGRTTFYVIDQASDVIDEGGLPDTDSDQIGDRLRWGPTWKTSRSRSGDVGAMSSGADNHITGNAGRPAG